MKNIKKRSTTPRRLDGRYNLCVEEKIQIKLYPLILVTYQIRDEI